MEFVIYILVFGAGFATGVIVANSSGGTGEEKE